MAARFNGRSSAGRAPALQAGGQEFESLRSLAECKLMSLLNDDEFSGRVFVEDLNQIIACNKTVHVYLENFIQMI